MALLEVKNLGISFGGLRAVDEFSITIEKGQLYGLIGPNGAGKTTIFNMLTGVYKPTDGTIVLDGKNITGKNTIEINRAGIARTFQNIRLFKDMTVLDNVKVALHNHYKYSTFTGVFRLPRYFKLEKAMDAKALELLKVFELDDKASLLASGLPYGDQRKLEIARALATQPKLLLLDEPLGALDLKMRKDMQIELMDMHKRLGITFIYVTHDQEEALTMSDKIIVMRDGEVQQIGTPKKIYDEPANAFVADFIGESNIMSGIMIDDYKCSFFDTEFECVDKGFKPNEPVDIIVRPEDIYITKGKNVEKGQLTAKVTSCVFKGDHYEILCESDGNELQIVENTECAVGEEIGIFIPKEEIHIMHKARIINEYETEMGDNGIVKICEADFETKSDLPAGTKVKVSIPFDKVDVTDDEADGTVSADVVSSIYKGSYYQVILRTDFDYDFFVDTQDEWLKGDRVGINIKPEDIKVEAI